MRAPISGGPGQLVLEDRSIENFQCSRAPANVCVVGLSLSNRYIFSRFDLATGEQHHVLEVPGSEAGVGAWSWSLSPDGTTIAAVPFAGNENPIRLIPIAGGPIREIKVKGWNTLRSLDWAADGKGFFIASNPSGRLPTLLYVDLEGNATPLWQTPSYIPTWAIPSHNGKYIAIAAPTIASNVWMVKDF